jgi:hypothetical protein
MTTKNSTRQGVDDFILNVVAPIKFNTTNKGKDIFRCPIVRQNPALLGKKSPHSPSLKLPKAILSSDLRQQATGNSISTS